MIHNKIAIITGSAAGLGKEFSRRILQEGGKVVGMIRRGAAIMTRGGGDQFGDKDFPVRSFSRSGNLKRSRGTKPWFRERLVS